MEKKLTIAICTYNRVKLLLETMESLAMLNSIKKAEVLIVDNNSSDNTESEVAKFIQNANYEIRYINEKRQGLSFARNTAIEHSEGKYIAFLDDDAIPDSNWIESIIQFFEVNDEVYAVGGKIIPKFETERPSWLVEGLEYSYTIVDLGEERREYPGNLYPFGANMAFRRSVLEKYKFPTHLGRKGTTLISGEETWLFNKLKEENWEYCYIPNGPVQLM